MSTSPSGTFWALSLQNQRHITRHIEERRLFVRERGMSATHPMVSDLRESGSIEQDSSLSMYL
jgi:replicative DNA helicase